MGATDRRPQTALTDENSLDDEEVPLRVRVLVVDANPLLGSSLARLLCRAGYAAKSVSTALQATLAAEGHAFECGIFDVHLRGLDGADGVELAGDLLASGGVSAVVFFSGILRPEDGRRALELGPVVPKDAPVSDLLRAVANLPIESGSPEGRSQA